MDELCESILTEAKNQIISNLKELLGKKEKKLSSIKKILEKLPEESSSGSDTEENGTKPTYIQEAVLEFINRIKEGLISSLLKELTDKDEEYYTLKDIKMILADLDYVPPRVDKKKVPIAKSIPKGPLLTTKDESKLRRTSHLCLQYMKEGYYIDPRTKIAFQQKDDNEWYAVGMYCKGSSPEPLDEEHKIVCANNCFSIADWEERDDLSPTPPEYPERKRKSKSKKGNDDDDKDRMKKGKTKSRNKSNGEEPKKKGKSKHKESDDD